MPSNKFQKTIRSTPPPHPHTNKTKKKKKNPPPPPLTTNNRRTKSNENKPSKIFPYPLWKKKMSSNNAYNTKPKSRT